MRSPERAADGAGIELEIGGAVVPGDRIGDGTDGRADAAGVVAGTKVIGVGSCAASRARRAPSERRTAPGSNSRSVARSSASALTPARLRSGR
jgi:hypothetical protein